MSEPIDTVLVRKPSWRDHIHDAVASLRVRVLVGVGTAGLLALLYLSQVAAVNTASVRLADLRSQSSQLQRQDANLHQQLGTATSPAYVDARARAMGLAPAPTSVTITVIAIKLQALDSLGGQS